MASGTDSHQGFMSENLVVLGFAYLLSFVENTLRKYSLLIFQDFMENPLIWTPKTFHFPVKNLTLLAGENIIEN